jgi:hypothetical protein
VALNAESPSAYTSIVFGSRNDITVRKSGAKHLSALYTRNVAVEWSNLCVIAFLSKNHTVCGTFSKIISMNPQIS